VANGKDRMDELVSKHGEGKTAAELAAGATGAYNTKLAEMKGKLDEVVIAEALLQTQTATRIKEGLVLDELKLASEGGLTEAELANIQVIQTAMGLKDNAMINGMLSVQRGSTLLAEFRATHAAEFDTGNVANARSYAAAADFIGDTTNNKIIPTLKGFDDNLIVTGKSLFALKNNWDGIQSKTVTIDITTIRRTVDMAPSAVVTALIGLGTQAAAATAGTGASAAASAAASAGAAPKATGNKNNAMGGSLQGGRGSYLVGELGPELFNPAGTGGTIVPNNKLMGGGGLAIGTLNVYGVQSTSELFNQLSKEARARGMQFAVN